MHAKTVNLLSTLSHADSCKMITFSFYYYPRGNLKTKKKKKIEVGEPTSQCNPERHLILVYAVFYKYTYMLEVLTKKKSAFPFPLERVDWVATVGSPFYKAAITWSWII